MGSSLCPSQNLLIFIAVKDKLYFYYNEDKADSKAPFKMLIYVPPMHGLISYLLCYSVGETEWYSVVGK